jgi:ribosomal protein S27E
MEHINVVAQLHRTSFGHYVLMANYRRSEEDERRILRCATCDGTVFAEIADFGRADANTACASCGMTLVDSPFSGGDYFDVIMKVGRPISRGARLRRAG